MASNRSLLATKNGLINTLASTGRRGQGAGFIFTPHSCPCRLNSIPQKKISISSPSVSFFSTTAKSSKPATSTPTAAPKATSPCSVSSNASASTKTTSSSTPPPVVATTTPSSAAASAASGVAPSSSTHIPRILPFSYDPTGLSAQAVKKPSCDNLNLKKSFYRRKLPDHLISFTSPQGKQLFREMLEEGYGFFSLVGNFTTQSETAFCGPSSLAMVLNSLEVDPQRQWKGAWRWYSDELLQCCAPTEQVKAKGITFNQFACLSKCHCDVQVRRANQTSLEQFKKDLEMVCSRDDIHMVVSFSRKALGQTGDGHFSPIGGYVPKAGMVLVLDTARFKYPSYFVSVEKLYESLFPIDVETGTSRGYFLLSANPNQPAISLCKIPKATIEPNAPITGEASTSNLTSGTTTTVTESNTATVNVAQAVDSKTVLAASTTTTMSAEHAYNITTSAAQGTTASETFKNITSCSSTSATKTPNHTADNKMSWTSLAQTFCKDLPSRIQMENPQTLDRMFSVVLQGIPREYAFWVSQQQAHRLRDTTELIQSVRSTELFSLVSSAFPAPDNVDISSQQHESALVFGTLFLMSSPSTLFLTLPVDVSKQFERLRRAALNDEGHNKGQHRVLKEEAERMRTGIVDLVNSFCSCGPKSEIMTTATTKV
ncbi:hypothetical protein BX616_004454 [Lobosporangium transversale]|nr:hypothetical protein BX616_004454 [Lobosporangium transversale]